MESARASSRFDAIVFGTFVDFIETLKFVNSSRSISSTNSTAAATSASTGLSYSSSRRWAGSEPRVDPDPQRRPRARWRAPRRARPCPARRCSPGSAARSGRRRRAPSSASVSLKWMSAITGIGESLDDRLERLDVLIARDGDADDVGARLGDPTDLGHRRREVGGFGLGHRLNGDRRASADRHAADLDLALRGHGQECRRRRAAKLHRL